MIESPDGRVGGSIDRARVKELLAGTKDKELQAHYREVLGEPAEDQPVQEDEAADRPSSSSESETSSPSGSEVDADGEEDLDALRAEAESRGVKVDGRWGAQRLQDEIDSAPKSKGKR